ncbi:aldo/keto reductase [Fulvivirgaceae bacterium BMA12]|uniref:Aldo/keto reductase n=1 Tax=Agaribacillus aureus TaxID=3051825 RepID=A0ABT8KYE3_9BACT|nr:aldo/keto reductase [Fulvivirgaceae bacterium BMA12]
MKTRRSTLKSLAVLTAGLLVPAKGLGGNLFTPRDKFGELLPLRLLGKTGEKVTMLGLGGAHIARCDEKTAEAQIECAIEGGIRFFDNAHMYGNGLAEERYGKFLVPKYRDVSFIMTKTTAKTGKDALTEFEQSLSRMKLDYVDLWQIHSIGSPEDVDSRIEEEVLEVFRKAKESGKARYIGFTGHRDFNAHKQMLKRTNILETCQMPINCFDPNYKSFINNVLPTLVEKEVGVLAMKTLSNGGFFGGTSHFEGGKNPKIVPNVVSVKEAIHFVWSLPVSTLITGANDVPMLQEKIDLAKSFKKMNDNARMELVERVGNANLDGAKVEFYKA